MDPNFYNSTISLIIGIFVLSIFSFTDTYSQNSEMSVIVKIIKGDKFLDQIWDINAQLRDNSTQDLNRYSIFVDASSTIDDIDVFGKIDSVKKENNQITLNLSNAR